MIFLPTKLDKTFLIEQERHMDERGYFARVWCKREFAARGLTTKWVQSSVSFNKHPGTIRGMHFQAAPDQETKIVRCTSGSIYDVVVDVRVNSATFGNWQGFELRADLGNALYISAGFAHGFQTLEPNTEVLYQMNQYFCPESAKAFHYADAAVGISWPRPVSMVSANDDANPTLETLVRSFEKSRQLEIEVNA